jgi:hypothetical protein
MSVGHLGKFIKKVFFSHVWQTIIKFSEDQVLPVGRRKQLTVVGFLSLVGGFLGLFAGFSVLSGFDLLYFFIIEPLTKRNGARVQSEAVERRPVTYVNDYLGSSSIHGFSHIGNSQKSKLQR